MAQCASSYLKAASLRSMRQVGRSRIRMPTSSFSDRLKQRSGNPHRAASSGCASISTTRISLRKLSPSSTACAVGGLLAVGRRGSTMARAARSDILARLRAMRGRGEPIIGAGAGTGISAKCEEQGGADLIVIYNSGRYRMAGRGSLAGMMPFGDANAIVLDMAREVLPVVTRTPVLAGVCGTDPFRLMPQFLAEVKAAGFTGVQNFPT